MATIINNPDSSNSGSGGIIAVILVIVVLALLFIFGIPALRGADTGGTTINVPDTINVDVTPNEAAQ